MAPRADRRARPKKLVFDEEDEVEELIGDEPSTLVDDDHIDAGEDEEDEDDEDDDEINIYAPVPNDDQDDSGSEVEEVSMAATRRQERQRISQAQQSRHKAHAERSAKQQRKQSAKPKKPAKRVSDSAIGADDAVGDDAAGDAIDEADVDDDNDDDDAPAAGRLDPALFASAFARQDASAREALKPKRTRRRAAKTVGNEKIVKAGGNTIIRTFDEEPAEQSEDAPLQYNALSRAVSMPSSKAQGLKKRKLGLAKGDIRATAIDASRPKPAKARVAPSDDPLGLGDPALLPGGELFGFSSTKSSKASRTRKRPSARGKVRRDLGPRGAGGRVRAPTGARTFGPAINFSTR
ncbi:hypothetical protein MCUN1_000563 [Malassezia cuniculi]|uniref:Uncharacterized protein n=1 Tax=Malassezia cuniculi TaxID=948313 RepID=A0AAF0J517_9BASI|nr:hypothetical protein MCUN1_000563 [Malassezia cuniculi]